MSAALAIDDDLDTRTIDQQLAEFSRAVADALSATVFALPAPFYANERVTLYHGEALAILRALPSDSVDAIITDPPYSSGGFTRGDRMADPSKKYVQTAQALQFHTFGGDTRDQRAFLTWCTLWLAECWRIAKPGAPICLFTDWRQLPTTSDALQCADFVWRGIVPWDKTEAVRPVLGRFRAQAEYVVWGSKGAMPLAPDIGTLPGAYRFGVERGADKQHMTGKPVKLMRELAKICPRDGVILDPFAGSASTAVGAIAEGRRCITIEREAHYAGVSRDRLAGMLTPFGDIGHRVVADIDSPPELNLEDLAE